MTTVPTSPPPLPHRLVEALVALLATVYEAGWDDRASAQPPTSVAEPEFLDRGEAAALLRCGLTKLDGLVSAGLVRSVLHGGRRMFHRSDLTAYLRQLGDAAPESSGS